MTAGVLLAAALVFSPSASSGSAAQDAVKKEAAVAAEPAKETPKGETATLELRVLANKKHDAEGVEKAMAPDGVKSPPMGYRWVAVDEKADVAPSDQATVRDGPEEGGKKTKLVLVKLDRQNITETDLARIHAAKDEGKQPVLGVELTRSGGRRFERLCREHLPEAGGAPRYRLAFIVDGVVRAAPVIPDGRAGAAHDWGRSAGRDRFPRRQAQEGLDRRQSP